MLIVKQGDTANDRQGAIDAYLADPASEGVILAGDRLLQKGDDYIVVSECVDPQHYDEWGVVEVFTQIIRAEVTK